MLCTCPSLVNCLRQQKSLLHSTTAMLSNESRVINIGAPISFAKDDTYFKFGMLMINAWSMFIEWVNVQRGGIIINNETYLLNLLLIEDFSDVI